MMIKPDYTIALFAFLTIFPTFIWAQKSVSMEERAKVIEDVKNLIDARYVLAHKSDLINNQLDSLMSIGRYAHINDNLEFAKLLSEDLVDISGDKHFKIQFNPELVRSRREDIKRRQEVEENPISDKQEGEMDINYWYAQKSNFGVQKVEILDGNIGYIKLTFFDILDWVQNTIDATMNFVTNTDALIIDIRDNGGGYISSSYLGSYFCEEDPIIWNIGYNRPLEQRDTTFTFKDLGSQRYLKKPIYILVNEKSFSRAEEFAYCMKHHGKAIIVGQQTAGAAHAIDFLEIDDNFLIQLPVTSSIHPLTKTDWEGIGVIPDIETTNSESLKVARTYILDELIRSEKHIELGRHYDKLKKKYRQIKDEINN